MDEESGIFCYACVGAYLICSFVVAVAYTCKRVLGLVLGDSLGVDF
ncbi:MAG: hypothetical protein LUD00_01470 [Prevotellaceae bacterium]|nr:hypothetical protein [Prevotellaceae bacterium]